MMTAIEVTKEMVWQIYSRIDFVNHGDDGIADGLTAVFTDVERDRIRPLLNLIRDLTDSDECWFDHHGGCQAHGYLSLEPGQKCPHQEAREILEAAGIELS